MKQIKLALIGISCLALSACGGGGGGASPDISTTGGVNNNPTNITTAKVGIAKPIRDVFFASFVDDEIDANIDLYGSDGAPTIKEKDGSVGDLGTLSVNGKTYDFYSHNAAKFPYYKTPTPIPYAVQFMSMFSEKSSEKTGIELVHIGAEIYEHFSINQVVTSGHLIFHGTPTAVSDLPKATANYKGKYNWNYYQNGKFVGDITKTGGDLLVSDFSATVDFGVAQKVTGSFFEYGDQSSEVAATLDADIIGNGFVGTITQKVEADNPITALGVFMGAGASSIVGAGSSEHHSLEKPGSTVLFTADKQ